MLRSLITAALLLTSLSATAAPKVLVLPFESGSVDPDLTRAATELLVIYLKDRGLETTSPPEKPADVDAAARAAAADHVVEGRLTRVGMKAIVFVEMRKVGATSAGWTGRMTSARPEDLEAVMVRMARGIDTGERVEDTQDIHSVTESEQANLKRKRANNYFGVNLAGYGSLDMEEVLTGFGVFWLYDVRTMMFELDFHAQFNDDANRTGLAISGYYPFTEDDITPYVGGGLEYGGFSFDSGSEYEDRESNTGLSGQAGLGLLMGRTSNVALRADVRYAVAFYEVSNERPHGVTFSLGLGF